MLYHGTQVLPNEDNESSERRVLTFGLEVVIPASLLSTLLFEYHYLIEVSP